jgi:hypothetical protein
VGDCSAIRDLASDELSYSLQRFKCTVQLPDMTGNTTAQITWKERFTPDGGGSPTDIPQTCYWDGVATETGEYWVNEPASKGTGAIVDVAMTCPRANSAPCHRGRRACAARSAGRASRSARRISLTR